MMKFALMLLTEISDRGGIEVFTKYFFETIVDSLTDTSLKVIILHKNDYPNINIKDTQIKFFNCYSKYKIIEKIKFTLLLLAITIFQRPDFIIANHIQLLRPITILHSFIKTKIGMVVYGKDVWNINYLDWITAKYAKTIASFSKYTAFKITNKTKIDDDKVYILPPPIDPNKFYKKVKSSDLIKKYDLENKVVILTVARLSSEEGEKGYEKVIHVLPKIIERIPNIKYLIVGEGDDSLRLNRLIGDLGLEDKVTLCGFVHNEKLVDYYNICDVFVMPSKQEGFGIVFLEALACGKPVIAGNKDGSVDAVLGGEIGVLVDPDNLDEIASAIIKVLKKETPNKLLDGEILREKVIESYGLDRFKERVKCFLTLTDK